MVQSINGMVLRTQCKSPPRRALRGDSGREVMTARNGLDLPSKFKFHKMRPLMPRWVDPTKGSPFEAMEELTSQSL